MLKNHADFFPLLLQLLLAQHRQIVSADFDRSAGRSFKKVNAAEQRALARSRSADDAEDFTFLQLQVNATQGDKGIRFFPYVYFFYIYQLDQQKHPLASKFV